MSRWAVFLLLLSCTHKLTSVNSFVTLDIDPGTNLGCLMTREEYFYVSCPESCPGTCEDQMPYTTVVARYDKATRLCECFDAPGYCKWNDPQIDQRYFFFLQGKDYFEGKCNYNLYDVQIVVSNVLTSQLENGKLHGKSYYDYLHSLIMICKVSPQNTQNPKYPKPKYPKPKYPRLKQQNQLNNKKRHNIESTQNT